MTATRPAEGDRGRLGPDGLADLEEQRDFLLASIDDLDRELAAGDLGEEDHGALRDEYTARAAEVLRAIDERRMADVGARPQDRPRRTFAVVALVAVAALLAGALVARASGRRGAGDTVTGADGVRLTATQEANRCIDITGQGEAAKAIGCYRKVLDTEPSNPTALTYLGWTLVLSSDALGGESGRQAVTAAKSLLAKAVAADPGYPDARAFRAIIAEREGRRDDARTELDALDELDPPPAIKALTSGLRARLGDPAGPATTTTTVP